MTSPPLPTLKSGQERQPDEGENFTQNHPFQRFGLAATFAAATALEAAGPVSAATCESEDELLIGDHQPLSGASAAFGEQTHRGVILAIKHYNDGTHPMNPTPKGRTRCSSTSE